jgi:hypothetical protein
VRAHGRDTGVQRGHQVPPGAGLDVGGGVVLAVVDPARDRVVERSSGWPNEVQV